MSDLTNSLHVLSPGDKSIPHVHSIITGRKSWKTLKGKTEAVWPPYLENALFEGLAKYQPANPRASKSLGRFPNRNRFISDHIHKTTGKYRTPKQVGSRLQQLRDTCQGKQLLYSLSKGHRSSSERSDDGVSSSPSPMNFISGSESQLPSRTVVTIDILPKHNSSRPSIGSNGLFPSASSFHSPSTSPMTSPTSSSFPAPFGDFSGPRPINAIDPTVTFTSRSSITGYSSFSVLLDGMCVHTEVADLTLSTTSLPINRLSPAAECTFYYSATLVPLYWEQLCQCPDPTRYTILHDILEHSDPSTPGSSNGTEQRVACAVEYRFAYPETPYPSPQLSPTETVSSSGSSTLASPTSYNFDFLSGYPSDGMEHPYAEVNDLNQVDYLTNQCFPDYSPGSASTSSLASADPLLGTPSPLNAFEPFGTSNLEVASVTNNQMPVSAHPFLPQYHASE